MATKKRRVFEVAPNGARWTVKERGVTGEISSHSLKEDAIARGRALALANQPSQLVIKRADGTIETEHTYGSDPYPPAG